MNRSLYEKAEEQIEATRDRIREVEGRIDNTTAELAVIPMFEDVRTDGGGLVLSSQDRMNGLVAQYVRATARYSARHPDVIQLSREIRTLAEQSGEWRQHCKPCGGLNGAANRRMASLRFC